MNFNLAAIEGHFKDVLTTVIRHLHSTVPILTVASIITKFADCSSEAKMYFNFVEDDDFIL